MDVCLSMGNSSEKVVSMLSKVADNVKFYSYRTVGDMIKDAKLRHLEFDRMVLSKVIFSNPDKEFEMLNSFIREYGSNTEIVLVVSEGDENGIVRSFKKYFDAPMYTPAILVKGTSRALLDLIQLSVLEVKTKYYILDADEESGGTSDVSAGTSTGEQDEESGSVGSSSNGFGFGSGPSSVYSGYGGNVSSDWNSSEKEYTENSEYGDEDGGDDDDDELSIGDLGGQHTDTGYLDDFDDAELAAQFDEGKGKRGKKGVAKKDEVSNLDSDDPSIEIDPEEQRAQYEEKVIESVNRRYEKELTISANLNIDLVVSAGKYRCTQDMIDEALDLYRRDGAKVLIIDLDTTSNRILSLLHTSNFYSNNCQEGITKQRVYVEDNIGICSNGFGVPVTSKDIKALLSSKMIRKYDIVFIDCPTECLGIFDEELIRMCHVLVFTGGALEDMSNVTLGLTNRSIVKLEVEKYIMRNCEVEVKGTLRKDDVEFLRDNCLFANGCWLDKIS